MEELEKREQEALECVVGLQQMDTTGLPKEQSRLHTQLLHRAYDLLPIFALEHIRRSVEPLSARTIEELEEKEREALIHVQELEQIDLAILDQHQADVHRQSLQSGYDLLNAIGIEVMERSVAQLQAALPAFIERMKRAEASIDELTQRWGYRDITQVIQTEYERLGAPLTDPATNERPCFLCVLQTPEDDTVYCWKTARLFEELAMARARGQEYSHCPAPDPADPTTPWFVEVVREGNEDGHGQPPATRRGNRNNEQ